MHNDNSIDKIPLYRGTFPSDDAFGRYLVKTSSMMHRSPATRGPQLISPIYSLCDGGVCSHANALDLVCVCAGNVCIFVCLRGPLCTALPEDHAPLCVPVQGQNNRDRFNAFRGFYMEVYKYVTGESRVVSYKALTRFSYYNLRDTPLSVRDLGIAQTFNNWWWDWDVLRWIKLTGWHWWWWWSWSYKINWFV